MWVKKGMREQSRPTRWINRDVIPEVREHFHLREAIPEQPYFLLDQQLGIRGQTVGLKLPAAPEFLV